MIDIYKITVVSNTAGAGVATGNTTLPQQVNGFLEWVYIDHDAADAATADTTITCEGNVSQTLLVQTNSATDGMFYPRASIVTTANAAITDGSAKIAVCGQLKGLIAQTDNSKTTNIYVAISKDGGR